MPTRILFGERDRYVSPRLLPGYEPYADDMEVELVPDSGHFIVEEKPDLVVERAARVLRLAASGRDQVVRVEDELRGRPESKSW